MECDPDGGDDRERDERRHVNGYRPEQRAGARGDQATAAERARYAPPERDIREQVERGAAAEGEGRDRVELVADVCERRSHREREENDACDHRKMQVGVNIAGEGCALSAAAVDEHLLPADREEI